MPLKGKKSALQKMLLPFMRRPQEVTLEFFFGGSEIKFDVTYRGQQQPTPTPLKYDVEDTATDLVVFN